MSYDYALHGHLRYASPAAAQHALAALDPLLEHNDPDFAATVRDDFAHFFTLDGADLTVELDLSGPGDFWFSLEALAETLAEPADEGHLDGYHELFEDEGPERFSAGGAPDESA